MAATGNVLLVEDDPAIRGLLSLTIQDEGYAVETADDGQEAFEKVHRQRPDAIVLDLALPVMDGWTLIELLDKDAQTRHIPIITMSACHRFRDVGERSVRAFLSKPFDLDTLMTVLEDIGAWKEHHLTGTPP